MPKRAFWTEERILLNAKQYRSRIDWINENRSAYAAALRLDIITQATQHMDPSNKTKPQGYWQSEENLIAEAKRYKCWSDFRKHSNVAYKNVLLFDMKQQVQGLFTEQDA